MGHLHIGDHPDLDLQAFGEATEVSVNSDGGSALPFFAASEIVRKRKIAVRVAGIAAGSAVLLLCGSPHVTMARQGRIGFMEHRPGSAEVLEKLDAAYASMVASRSDLTEPQVRELMADNTWLDAERALRVGLVDEIVGSDVPLLVLKQIDEALMYVAGCLTKNRGGEPETGAAWDWVQAELDGRAADGREVGNEWALEVPR